MTDKSLPPSATGERSRLLLALDRMIESAQEDINLEDVGNYATISALIGEKKGLSAARELAERCALSETPQKLGVNAWLTAKAVEGILNDNHDEPGSKAIAIPFTLFEWRDILTGLRAVTTPSASGRTGLEARYEEALRYIGKNATAGKDWRFAQFILEGMSVEEAVEAARNLYGR